MKSVRIFVSGVLVAAALSNLQLNAGAADNSSLPTNSVLWVDDALPAGAVPGTDGGDSWTWVSSNPAPFVGTLASQSSFGSGLHQHFFSIATGTLTVSNGETLFAYVYLDPSHLPTELMLQWNDGTWEHRAFWGANNISYGTLGTPTRSYAGPLPAAGQWTRLEVPASQVGLEGSTLQGMSFTLFDGGATWDAAGKAPGTGVIPPADTTPPSVTLTIPTENALVSGTAVAISAVATDNVAVVGVQFKLDGNSIGPENTTAPYAVTFDSTLLPNGPHAIGAIVRDAASNRGTAVVVNVQFANVIVPPNTNSDVVWIEDSVPDSAITGADGGDDWTWVTSNPTPFSGTSAHQSNLSSGSHQHFFNYSGTTLTINTGEVLLAYVYLDPVNPPSEVMLQWNDGSWEHRAYWGASLNTYGVEGTVSRRAMGPLPHAGQWVRLEVPANLVGLEGSVLKGMSFTLYGGQATWDHIGKKFIAKASARLVASGVEVSWPSIPGQTYRVMFKYDPSDPNWYEISGPITATDSITAWTDPDTFFDESHFYRIVQ